MKKAWERVLALVQNAEERNFLLRNLARIDQCERSHQALHSDFLNPYQQKLFEKGLCASPEVKVQWQIDQPFLERRLAVVYPAWMEPEDLPQAAQVLWLKGDLEDLAHSDFLGALLGLGIRRDKIGDVLLYPKEAAAVVDASLEDFIALHLLKVGNRRVEVQRCPTRELCEPLVQGQERTLTVASFRADALIAEIFNLSRSEAKQLIAQQRLKVDHEPILSPDRTLQAPALLSLRGHGRAKILTHVGTTRKDNQKIRVWLFS